MNSVPTASAAPHTFAARMAAAHQAAADAYAALIATPNDPTLIARVEAALANIDQVRAEVNR